MNIKEICQTYNIQNYTINDDGSIDVDDDVILYNKELTKLPLKFNKVSGNFSCSFNNLTSLEGCPDYLGGYFFCSSNNLTSLECGPKEVGGDFWCYSNPLPKEIFYNTKAYLKQLNRDKLLNELLNN